MRSLSRLVLAALTLPLALQACDFAGLGEALELDDEAPNARQVTLRLGVDAQTAALEDSFAEERYIAAAEADLERRQLRGVLVGDGCEEGEPAAYRAWSDRANVVVVESALNCPIAGTANGMRDVTLTTYLRPDRVEVIASCWLSGDRPEDQMIYAIGDDGHISGSPRVYGR